MSAALDVVIVTYGNHASVGACVERARALRGVGRVVVVDHGTDGSGDVAAAAGAVVMRDPTNPGFGAGQNRGVAATDAPVVLLCNPDAVVEAEGIAAGLATLAADATVGAVQGVIMNRTTGAPERSSGRELAPVHLVGRAVGAKRLLRWEPIRAVASRVSSVADHIDRVPDAPVPVEYLAATVVLVRRAAFEAVGGFDEGYFLYGEDLDLCRRLRERGWRLVALPEPFAVHESGGSAASDTARELTWWRGTMRFAALRWSTSAWITALVAAAIAWARETLHEPRAARRAWRELVWGPMRDRRSANQPPKPSSASRSMDVPVGNAMTS